MIKIGEQAFGVNCSSGYVFLYLTMLIARTIFVLRYGQTWSQNSPGGVA